MSVPDLRLFRPTREQLSLLPSARRIFETVAAATEAGVAPGPGWRMLGDSGFLGAGLSEQQGGLGLDASDLVLLTEEAGAVLLAGPVVETLWIGVPALAALGEDAAGRLDRVLSGDELCTAVDTSDRAPDLDAAASVVVPGDEADVVVPSEAFGRRLERVATADRLERSFRAPGLVLPKGAPVPRLRGVGSLVLGRLGGAAYLLGVARWLLDTTVAHTSLRTQFGAPIGSFQAVRHRLADVHTELEFARSAVWSAACELEEEPAYVATSVLCAAVVARRAFAEAERHCLQAHGGLGFTWDHPLHVRIKRGQTFAHRFGSRRRLETTLGDLLLAEAAAAPRVEPPRPSI